MHWIRANRKWGARLALFALAVQLVLSFGHIHAEDLGLATNTVVKTQATLSGETPAPQNKGDTHDPCAICIALSLSATSVLPVLPAIELPIAHELKWPGIDEPARIVFNFPSSYRARAPPLA